MFCVRKVTEDLYWVGGNDKRLACLKIFTLFQEEFHIIHIYYWIKKLYYLIL